MKHFTRDELKTLIELREGPAVSLFLPTVRAGKDVRGNPIAFKNALRRAEAGLEGLGCSREQVRRLLEPLEGLDQESPFWSEQKDTLAVFLAPGFARWYRLSVALPEAVHVEREGFHVQPMIRTLAEDGEFWLLTLSMNSVRLFEGTRDSLREVQVEGMPTSMEDVRLLEGREESLEMQFNTRGGGQGPRRGAMRGSGDARPGTFHGRDPRDLDKERVGEFFRRVDGALRSLLQGARRPVVLAGVEYLHPIYRSSSGFDGIAEGGIHGNVDEMSLDDLQAKAWACVEPLVRSRFARARQRWHDLAGTGLASADIEQVVPAACQGRVETLFVGSGAHRWGRYVPGEGRVELDVEGTDLLNLSAVQTLAAGGEVLPVEAGEVPGGGMVAAVFRY